MAPSYLLSEFKHAYQIHSYNIRGCDLLHLPLAKTAKYQGRVSQYVNGARACNALPQNIRQTEKLSEFNIKLKCHLKGEISLNAILKGKCHGVFGIFC